MEVVEGTVYAELKLSEQLMIELKQVKAELRRTKQTLLDSEQATIGMTQKVGKAYDLQSQCAADLEILNFQALVH